MTINGQKVGESQSISLKVKGSVGEMLVDAQALVSEWLPSMDMQTI